MNRGKHNIFLLYIPKLNHLKGLVGRAYPSQKASDRNNEHQTYNNSFLQTQPNTISHVTIVAQPLCCHIATFCLSLVIPV